MAGKKKKRVMRTESQKSALLSRWQRLRAQGMTANAAAEELGVSYITLHSWVKKGIPAKAAPVKVRGDVKVVGADLVDEGAEISQGIVLTTPQGFRVEGMGPADVVEVLRALRS